MIFANELSRSFRRYDENKDENKKDEDEEEGGKEKEASSTVNPLFWSRSFWLPELSGAREDDRKAIEGQELRTTECMSTGQASFRRDAAISSFFRGSL